MIDLERARELLALAVSTRGRDFVYNLTGPSHDCDEDGGALRTCFYEPRPEMIGRPQSITGCLIGTALTLAGETTHIGYEGSVVSLQCDYPRLMNQAAAVYFQRAQKCQDYGDTWGDAFDAAERSYELLKDMK